MDADRSNGLFGALIVRKSERTDLNRKLYDIDSKEHVILISEWSGKQLKHFCRTAEKLLIEHF